MAVTYLIAGSNLGDRLDYIQRSILRMKEWGTLLENSCLYESEPWGFHHEQWFLNQVFALETALSPEDLLLNIHSCENQMGRNRSGAGYLPRTIDIDILFYGKVILQSDTLILPHPQIAHRKFVLIPMAEIAPGYVHPVLGKTMWEMLTECKDTCQVNKYSLK